MNAVTLYVTTCRYIVKCNLHNQDSWADLYRYLPYLRQALSCCVCTNVLQIPMAPLDTICQHHVCKQCIGGKMKLKPSCSWCKNYDQFVEKPQLRIVVQCFKNLCQYLSSSAIGANLSSINNGGTNALLTIIQEGVNIQDNYSYFDNIPPLPVLPPLIPKQRPLNIEPVPENTPPVVNSTTSNHDIEDTDCDSHGQSLNNSTNSFSSTSEGPPGLDRITAEHDYNKDLRSSCSSGEEGPPKLKLRKMDVGEILDSPRRRGSRVGSSEFSLDDSGSSSLLSASQSNLELKKPKRGAPKKAKPKIGCRCGLATPTPGKLTCCGQRCPCYSAFKGCIPDCRCRGCRNPRKVPVDEDSDLPSLTREQETDTDSEIEIDV